MFVQDNKQKVTDLSQTVKENCTLSLIKQVGKGTVELNVQPEFAEKSKNLLNFLEKSYKKTQDLLMPLGVEKIKFYLLQSDDVPVNYKISVDSNNEKFYLHLYVFKDEKDLEMNCSSDNNLCKEIFRTIPHELTHGALDNLIDRNARWFDEGLAEYIAFETGNSFVPQINKERVESYVPVVSLYRSEIRQNLWYWKKFDFNSLKKTSETDLQNDFFYYGASHQLIRLITEKANIRMTEKSLEILFTQLINLQKKKQRPIKSEEIIALIQEHLRVNPKELGNIGDQEQRKLVEESLKILSQNNLDIPKKFYALYILSGIDKVPISEKWVIYLLNEVYTGDQNTTLPNLAATALSRRIWQNDFDSAVEKYLKAENKDLSVKRIKKDLQKLSIRPPVN